MRNAKKRIALAAVISAAFALIAVITVLLVVNSRGEKAAEAAAPNTEGEISSVLPEENNESEENSDSAESAENSSDTEDLSRYARFAALSGNRLVELDRPLSNDKTDTDGDGIPDSDELFSPVFVKITDELRGEFLKNGASLPDVEKFFKYSGNNEIRIYSYHSDPTLPDTDFDGIPDGSDPAPRDNSQRGKMIGAAGYDIKEAEYAVDFRTLGEYSEKNAEASLVFANAAYYDGGFSFDEGKSVFDVRELMEYHGFEKIAVRRLSEEFSDGTLTLEAFDDDDVIDAAIGFHDFAFEGKNRRVIGIFIRGTNGTAREWSSNFDIGDPANWSLPYHKGFYITEERVREFVTAYVREHSLEIGADDILYWIAGHSRGGAVANLLAARLCDDGKNVAAYTFAAPAVTTDEGVHSAGYSTIYNFLNTSDVVPCVPLSQWGFERYGITKFFDMGSAKKRSLWSQQTGRGAYNAYGEDLFRSAEQKINDRLCDSREKFFLIDEKGRQGISSGQLNMLSERAKKYCRVEKCEVPVYNLINEYYLYPSPSLVFQLLAEVISGEAPYSANAAKLLREFWNTKYTVAILSFLGENISSVSDIVFDKRTAGITEGHAPATYYIMLL